MRARLFEIRAIAHAVGFALVGVALVATSGDIGADQAARRPPRTIIAPQTNPVVQELTRCDGLGTAVEQDAKFGARAENRQCLFTYGAPDSGSLAAQTRERTLSKPEDR
jgi:conjugative transfer region protein TrbK